MYSVVSRRVTPKRIRRSVVKAGDFGVGMARTDRAQAILPPIYQRQVMPRHSGVDMQNEAAVGANSPAQIRFLACDETRIEAACLLQRRAAHNSIAAAILSESWLGQPIQIKNAIVNGGFGTNFAAMPRDDH